MNITNRIILFVTLVICVAVLSIELYKCFPEMSNVNVNYRDITDQIRYTRSKNY